jgi:pimeloyl-ACP methyl ester carboxylesterase
VWDRLIPHLAGPAIATHRIPPGADPRRLSAADCARYVASQIAEAGLDRVVLVAHSIGGVIACELARVAPGCIAHAVLLAANVPGEGENAVSVLPPGQRLQIRIGQWLAARGLTPRKALARWIEETLSHDLDRQATEQMLRGGTNPEPSGLFFDRVSPRALASRPCTYVKLLQDRALAPAVQERITSRLGARRLSLDCGHTAMLARPHELASLLNAIAEASAEGRG